MMKSIIALIIAGTLGVTGMAVAPKSVTKPVTKAVTKTAKTATKAVSKAATTTTKAVEKAATNALNGVKADSYYKEYNVTPPKAPKLTTPTSSISKETSRLKTKWVNGYYRKNGTYVQGYYRS